MKRKINILCGTWLLAVAALLAPACGSDMSSPGAVKQQGAATIQKTSKESAPSVRATRGSRYPIRGKLRSVNLSAKTFTLSGASKDRVFVTDDMTVITKNGKPATLADAVPGDEVGGLAENLPDGKVLAIKVRFGPKTDEENQASNRRSTTSRKNNSKSSM